MVYLVGRQLSGQNKNKYFELRNSWGADGEAQTQTNYLLVMVSTFVMPFSMDPLIPRMTPGCITRK